MGGIHNTPFSLQLTNGSNKIEFYITLGWKGLPETNKLIQPIHKLRRK